MSLKAWFQSRKEEQMAARPSDVAIDDDIARLWKKCYNCDTQLLVKELESNLMVCPHCEYHFRINARNRIGQLVDEGTFSEMHANITGADPLNFVDTESYKDRQRKAKEKNNSHQKMKRWLRFQIKNH